ncbi:DNA-binding response regulator, NarL/FixJ family, contains REC and HTH domains [Nonomuraea solani]|uniref:DNA-binding response regulator, NarL/FixJ family, contains REC and HTH domains n=1 Tax=Nonomuraea solani TaxID=1144553 RepID=A0A1H6E4E9_9ACTN|nr:response regulator transcription factor [Nonomuraea solani]SEG91876.1 DNA-binding response regulator, NarL/FixJ family, contains REC and HTH domains [Nonomuraea solani]
MATRILIADDQEGIRSAFRLILDAQPDMTVVAEAADGRGAIETARAIEPDVVLADIRMPGADGIEVTRALADTGIHVVIVTTFGRDEYVHAALRHGACGFVLKRSGPALLVEAVRAAMNGDMLISPQLTVRLLRQRGAPRETPGVVLTGREEEIVARVAQGLTNAEIAAELFLAPGTVKNHVAVVQRKIDARNRVAIAAWAWATGRAEPG